MIPLRSDGWPGLEHVECFNEVEYLRRRVAVAEQVVEAARAVIAPDAKEDALVTLVYRVDGYATFLGLRPDPARVA